MKLINNIYFVFKLIKKHIQKVLYFMIFSNRGDKKRGLIISGGEPLIVSVVSVKTSVCFS